MRKQQANMPTPVVKFGALTADQLERIDHSDATHSASAAHYKFETRKNALDRQYNAEMVKIMADYRAELGECALNGAGSELE